MIHQIICELTNSDILLPSQGSEDILHGHREGMMPEMYTGGLGLIGALALMNYVSDGGTLVALDAASDFVIDQFGLPIRNDLKDIPQSQFSIPGSIVRLNVDPLHPIGYGSPPQVAASFVRSRAFSTIRRSNLQEGGRINLVTADPLPIDIIARYPLIFTTIEFKINFTKTESFFREPSLPL